MTKPPPSERDACFGPTESGKSHLLRVWARKHPRQLVLDATGEWSEMAEPGRRVEYAEDMGQLREKLRECAKAPGKWRVVISTEVLTQGKGENLEQLVQLLAPVYKPGRVSFTRSVGGLALIFDEAYEVCSHGRSHIVRPLWLRGRHNGLTILAASQRAADVGRMVTSQSGRVAITSTSEPIDLAYWKSTLPEEYYPHLLQLKERQAICYYRAERRASVITTNGVLVAALHTGEE